VAVQFCSRFVTSGQCGLPFFCLGTNAHERYREGPIEIAVSPLTDSAAKDSTSLPPSNHQLPLDHLDNKDCQGHSVVIPAKYFAQQSVAHCAALTTRALLGYAAFMTLLAFVGTFLHVPLVLLAGLVVAGFGHRMNSRCHQSAVYCDTSDTVITDCRTTQGWNRTRNAKTEIALGVTGGVVLASQFALLLGDMYLGLMGAALFVLVLLMYFYRLGASTKTFQKALQAGVKGSDGIHFTIKFSQASTNAEHTIIPLPNPFKRLGKTK